MVVERDGVKYACGPCIRGHRVKKCEHHDRQLFPLIRRGRQVSQCEHCRHLRKTNRSHVKCTCAISSMPNPINGCLCEIVHTCSCVASHLQDTMLTGKNHESSLSPSESSLSPSESSSLGDLDVDGTDKWVDFLTWDMDYLLAHTAQHNL